MMTLTEKEYEVFKTLVQMDQTHLKNAVYTLLSKKYSIVKETDHYVYAVGDTPIALIAHLDTVFSQLPSTIYYDREAEVLWSPQGLGADDRAGVFSILKILSSSKKRPTIIFCTDEEIGDIGARHLVEDYPSPISAINFIIELDRAGTKDCVFYDCDNQNFISYIEQFGFEEDFGSFSDISVICPAWGIAGVNLSIGYEDEHSFIETLHIQPMLDTIKKVKKILNEKDIPFFKYIPYTNKGTKVPCDCCGKTYPLDNLVKGIGKDKKTKYFCTNCCIDKADFCKKCGSIFETDENYTICAKCREEVNDVRND